MNSCYSAIAVAEYYRRSNLSCDLELLQAVYMQPPEFSRYIFSFIATLALEAPFYILLGKLGGISWRKIFICLFLCNLATHPEIHFLLIPYAHEMGWRTLNFILFAEAFAAFTECILGFLILRTPWWQTGILIVTANLFSWSFS